MGIEVIEILGNQIDGLITIGRTITEERLSMGWYRLWGRADDLNSALLTALYLYCKGNDHHDQ
jgi:hypothetical protein